MASRYGGGPLAKPDVVRVSYGMESGSQWAQGLPRPDLLAWYACMLNVDNFCLRDFVIRPVDDVGHVGRSTYDSDVESVCEATFRKCEIDVHAGSTRRIWCTNWGEGDVHDCFGTSS